MRKTSPATTITKTPLYPVLPRHMKDVNDTRYREEVVTAVNHLALVRKHQVELKTNNDNGSLTGLIQTNRDEVRKLITGDAAYRDAAAILYADMLPMDSK